MARKPSRIARRSRAVFLLIYLPFFAQAALAQEAIRVSEGAAAVENQFVSSSGPGATARHADPQFSRRGPRSYEYPTASTSPPLNIPLRPGPISRWQRPPLTVTERQGESTATLSASPVDPTSSDPIRQAAMTGDQQSAINDMRSARPAGSAASNAAIAAQSVQVADPLNSAPHRLTQPVWMLPDRDGFTVTSMANKSSGRLLNDPFDAKDGGSQGVDRSANGIDSESHRLVVFQAAGETLPAAAAGAPSAAPSSPNLVNVFASDFVNSPDGWYEQAEKLAHGAVSLDELSAVIQKCEQGLLSGPNAETDIALRRLAAWAGNRRGELLAEANEPQQALHEFQAAIRLDPECALAIHNRGVTLAQQNEPADALRDFQRVIELNPGLAIVYCNRAELLTSLGRLDEAIRDYDRALIHLGDKPELYCARAYAWQRQGNFERALADLNRAIRISPQNADAYCQRGNLAAERGDFDQAVNDFQRAIRIDPQWAEAYRSLAWLLATCPDSQVRNGQQALATAEKGITLAPAGDCFMLDALAAAQASTGRFDEASDTIRQAIAAAPPEFAPPLQERLACYQRKQPFIGEPSFSGRAPRR
jgi:tetratricopeptide (TPR) repeat protein